MNRIYMTPLHTLTLAAAVCLIAVWPMKSDANTGLLYEIRCVGLLNAASQIIKFENRFLARSYDSFSAVMQEFVDRKLGGRPMNDAEKAAYKEGEFAFDFVNMQDLDPQGRRDYRDEKFREVRGCARLVQRRLGG